MKAAFLIFLTAISFNSFSQTKSSPGIAKIGGLTVKEMSYGGILFMYRNPDYTTIVDILSFSVSNKDSAIFLMDEAIRILDMGKLSKDESITHTVDGVSLVRYSFNQKRVYLSDGKKTSIAVSRKNLLKIREALLAYNYSYQKTG